MSEISEIEIKSMTKEQNYMKGYEHGKSDVLDKIRADIESYEADCILADDSKECKECDKIVFGSIYRIIDKYRNEVSE